MQGCGEMMIGHLTLELDLTVMTRYGREQGVERGCNSRKPERYSHHPLMAFVADARLMANLFSGCVSATAIVPKQVLGRTLSNLKIIPSMRQNRILQIVFPPVSEKILAPSV